MSEIQTVDIQVPISTAYNQWTQLEQFPQFMGGVEEVVQTDDTHSRWRTRILGVEREFDTVITEQLPDERIAWTTTHGETEQAGVVTFHRLDENQTRVTVQMDIETSSMLETLGVKSGIVSQRINSDLMRFKEFIESRDSETGAWRGKVERPQP
ncbi:MAG: SRPBCC family protein [Sporichthyaceae bacterium]